MLSLQTEHGDDALQDEASGTVALFADFSSPLSCGKLDEVVKSPFL